MRYKYNDGGRKEAGFKGTTGDCVVRAIAIATNIPYRIVYTDLKAMCRKQQGGLSPRTGVARKTYDKYLRDLGWTWTPTMAIGSGCKVHLDASELPAGRIICQVTHHLVAVVDGTINDLSDCSREGMRCVYGYYSFCYPADK
jgi:hypothetical protein